MPEKPKAQAKASRADMLKEFQFGGIVVEESSFRLDQRKENHEGVVKPQGSSVQASKLMSLMEKNILQRYMDQV